MIHSQFVKRAATAGVCIGVGAAAGIAGSAAAPAKSPGSIRSSAAGSAKLAAAGATSPASASAPVPPVTAVKLGFGSPVHGVEVVPNKAGDGFDTVTDDSGTVKSVSGGALRITEGTDRATYATPTLTIPAGARVERNFETAALTDLQAGDHVDVSSDSDGTTSVLAMDAQYWPPKPPIGADCTKAGKLSPVPGAPGSLTSTRQSVGPGGSVGVSVAPGPATGGGAASASVAGVGGPIGVVCAVKAP